VKAEPRYPPQQVRLLAAAIYLAVLVAVGYFIHGRIPPPFTTEGLWFYGAFVPLLAARHLIEPWFARPADVLANSVVVLVAAAAVPSGGPFPIVIESGRLALAAYATGVLVLAVFAMAGRTATGWLGSGAVTATALAKRAGHARIMYSAYLILIMLAAHGENPRAIVLVAVAWVLVVLLQPVEPITAAIATIRRKPPAPPHIIVDGAIDPRLVSARAAATADVEVGTIIEWPSGVDGLVVDRSELERDVRLLIALKEPVRGLSERARAMAARGRQPAIGYVAADSSLQEVVVHAPAGTGSIPEVVEGSLLSATIRGQPTYFQVTGASVAERGSEGHRRQFVQVRARKLGVWSDEGRGFVLVPWLPDAGTAVALARPAADDGGSIQGIGRLPATSFHVGIDIERAVLFNTAILGILGVGKTSLAWELVQRMLCEGVRVVVIDITGEYGVRFRGLWPESQEKAIYDRLEERLAEHRTRQRVPRERAGNWQDLRPALREMYEDLVGSDSRLLILNPSLLDVTAEDGFPQAGEVPLRRVTNVEVVRLLTEELLDFARSTTPADPQAKLRPRFCLVLEEAHSLVPEGGTTADRSDQTATAGTARAILQGRKYGLGCLLITQRTANVTKTILNQCHTVFALRSFDATGEAFLANYVGREYTGLLATLRDRQAVFFGRASTSPAPVLIDLNDRDRFESEYWQSCSADVPITDLQRRPVEPDEAIDTIDEQVQELDWDEDIPDGATGWSDEEPPPEYESWDADLQRDR